MDPDSLTQERLSGISWAKEVQVNVGSIKAETNNQPRPMPQNLDGWRWEWFLEMDILGLFTQVFGM